MSRKLFGIGVVAASAAMFAGRAVSAEPVDIGKREYESNCAICHGTKGKGDGLFNEYLRVKTADITTLTRKNGGVFPVNRVMEVIDGRQVAGHGTREMPIWGDVYNVQAAQQFDDYPNNAALFVRARTLALIDYLNGLQVK